MGGVQGEKFTCMKEEKQKTYTISICVENPRHIYVSPSNFLLDKLQLAEKPAMCTGNHQKIYHTKKMIEYTSKGSQERRFVTKHSVSYYKKSQL